MSKDIIIGGGIAGLILGYFNPKVTIITENFGGQFSTPFPLGPKYIHKDRYSTRFMKELNLNPEVKTIKIGFYYNKRLHNKNTIENREKYFKKTRSSEEIYKTSMSADLTEFEAFDIGPNEIIDILTKKIKNDILIKKVQKINYSDKTLKTISSEKYNKLYVTIPKNIFLFLSGHPEIAKEFESHPTTFILVSKKNKYILKGFEKFDYVYFSEPKYPYHRVTKVEQGYVFEYRGDKIAKMKGEIDRHVMYVGQLIENQNKMKFEDITFFGRYAEWKHGIKVNDLLKKIYTNKL